MSMDKLFIFALAFCFFAFVIYLAWNSKQNEKKNAETHHSPSEPDLDTPMESETAPEPRGRKKKEGAHV